MSRKRPRPRAPAPAPTPSTLRLRIGRRRALAQEKLEKLDTWRDLKPGRRARLTAEIVKTIEGCDAELSAL